jgi:hypothetical protein
VFHKKFFGKLFTSFCWRLFWGSNNGISLNLSSFKKSYIPFTKDLPDPQQPYHHFSSITNVLWHQNPLDLCWRSLQSKRFLRYLVLQKCVKVDFESFSMQMHVPFLLNPIVKYSCVVILVVVQK